MATERKPDPKKRVELSESDKELSESDKETLREMSKTPIAPQVPPVFQETRQIYGVTNLEGKVLESPSRWEAEEHLRMAQGQYRFLGGNDNGPFKLVTRTEIVRQFVDDWHEVN